MINQREARALFNSRNIRWVPDCDFCRTKFRPGQIVKFNNRTAHLYCLHHDEEGEEMQLPNRNPGEEK